LSRASDAPCILHDDAQLGRARFIGADAHVGAKEGEVVPPATRCVGQRAVPARGRRLLDHELEDRIVVAVVLDKLGRICQIGEGEAWALLLALDEERGLARAQGIQRDPVCEVSLPIDRWSRDPSFDEGWILQNQDHCQLHAPRGAASDFDGLDQVD
jgi:hypothetical protein